MQFCKDKDEKPLNVLTYSLFVLKSHSHLRSIIINNNIRIPTQKAFNLA